MNITTTSHYIAVIGAWLHILLGVYALILIKSKKKIPNTLLLICFFAGLADLAGEFSRILFKSTIEIQLIYSLVDAILWTNLFWKYLIVNRFKYENMFFKYFLYIIYFSIFIYDLKIYFYPDEQWNGSFNYLTLVSSVINSIFAFIFIYKFILEEKNILNEPFTFVNLAVIFYYFFYILYSFLEKAYFNESGLISAACLNIMIFLYSITNIIYALLLIFSLFKFSSTTKKVNPQV